MADGFLGRWSRRKIDAKQGKPLEADPPVPENLDPQESDRVLRETGVAGHPRNPDRHPRESDGNRHPRESGDPVPAPPPTLEDVHSLTPESDFSRFVRNDVDPEVKNAAVRKLFADPHFNVMDGLDIYIDDYSKPDPLPPEMLRNLASAEFLGFFREEKVTPEPLAGTPGGARVDADDPAAEFVAQSQVPAQDAPGPEADPAAAEPAPPAPNSHADPDLRLQQDPAPGPQDPGGGAR
jgi:hypothetical protein